MLAYVQLKKLTKNINILLIRIILYNTYNLHRFLFYKNSFHKNHQAENCQKLKNILRIMARLKYMIKNLESPTLILHQKLALLIMECLLFILYIVQRGKI